MLLTHERSDEEGKLAKASGAEELIPNQGSEAMEFSRLLMVYSRQQPEGQLVTEAVPTL